MVFSYVSLGHVGAPAEASAASDLGSIDHVDPGGLSGAVTRSGQVVPYSGVIGCGHGNFCTFT